MIDIGAVVKPKSPGGLWLSPFPCDGTYSDRRSGKNVAFHGIGRVVAVHDIVIDYDTWPDSMNHGLDKVPYRNCLVVFPGGCGWAGEGALVRVKERKRNVQALHKCNSVHID